MHPRPTLTVLAAGQVADLPLSPSGRLPFWASPFPRRLANASGRIEFIIFLIMDWLFASGCSPPRLSATQLPSATDSQCSVRRGLSPRCWCALSGARGALLATPRSCKQLPCRRHGRNTSCPQPPKTQNSKPKTQNLKLRTSPKLLPKRNSDG